MVNEEILQAARMAVLNADRQKALGLVTEVHGHGGDVLELLDKAFIPVINEIGDRFSCGELFLPELILAAGVMQEVTRKVGELLPAGQRVREKRGVAVLGTVQGDVHDIGKALVVTMLSVNGYQVHDLGRDVPAEKFIQAALEQRADLIGSSALLTTTMVEQENLERKLKAAGLKGAVKTIVGGAPVTRRWAVQIGADGYAEDAAAAVRLADQLMGKG